MKVRSFDFLIYGVVCLAVGCGVPVRRSLSPVRAWEIETTVLAPAPALTSAREDLILALDPEHVTEHDVREVLAGLPAPHIFNIHGGIGAVVPHMSSFSTFLIGMGYPGQCITNPADGTYSFSCYEDARKIAGIMAWYYERDGLRPMLVGHSQGGIQVVKILHTLAGAKPLPVWNPLTWKPEERFEIVDPVTGLQLPVTDLKVSFATTVGAGGLTRLLPNQWDMNTRLHDIPDSVEEFTGFCKINDLWGGDYFGYGPANHFKPNGQAVVRNVWLPPGYLHVQIPETAHLIKSREIVEWINQYQASDRAVSKPRLEKRFVGDSRHILWAAEVWFTVKKHWVLEWQRLIRARREKLNAQ